MAVKTELHILPAFHYDVAYRKTFEGYLDQSLENISEALRLLGKYPNYTYCIEQVLLVREYWNRHESDRKALKKFAGQGRLIFAPGMFTMPDSNLPSGENFIRNALIGRQWLKKHLGVVPTCCWMADIFGHNPQSPQLAATCGFNSYMFERGKSGGWETSFLWKGIDGTAIKAHWEIDTYFGINVALAWIGDRPFSWIREKLYRDIIAPLQKESPAKHVLLSALGGDFLKPSEDHIAFVRAWNRKDQNVKMIFSTPEKYFAAVEKKKARMTIASDDMNPLLEGCNSSRIRLKQYNRSLEEMAACLEMLECGDAAGGHRMSVELWETITWNAFHDIICGSLVKEALKEALVKYRRAERRAERGIETKMKKAVRRMVPKGDGKGVVFFNSLPYPRREVVAVGSGFAEKEIPALGFALAGKAIGKTNPRGAVRIKKKGKILENSMVRIVFGPNGTIVSLYDKTNACELALANGMNNPLRQADYGDLWTTGGGPVNSALLRTGPFYNPQPLSGTTITREGRVDVRCADAYCYAWPEPVVVHDNPLQCTVKFGYPQLGCATQISLRKGEKLVRFKSTFVPSGKKYRLRVAFPTAINNGTIRHSVPFGHITRPQGEYAAQGWIDYADSNKGLALLNKGLPGNNVTDGVMMLSLFRAVSMEDAEKNPWYEEGIEHTFEYALMPFNPRDKNYNPAREAAIFNRELHSAVIRGVNLRAKPRSVAPFIELKADNAELSCLNRRGDELTLRIWESRGKKGRATCVLADEIGACLRCEATEENRKPQAFSGHEIPINLNPFEIVTLKVTLK